MSVATNHSLIYPNFSSFVYEIFYPIRGWNYVGCLEDVVWGNKFHDDPNQCWKMTSLCRNVFATSHMDEFGHGATAPTANIGIPDTVALVLGLLFGVLASVAMYWGVRGRFSRKEDDPHGHVEFTRVPKSDPTDPETELTI